MVHAPLVYDDSGQHALKRLYESYINVAASANLPFLMCSPTWRANQERVKQSRINPNINVDAIHFLQAIREESVKSSSIPIVVGGLIGCKNDCYLPEEALSTNEAEDFHSWQVEQMILAKPDFLIASTIPSVKEAAGIAKAICKKSVPGIISFVINRNGIVLDGTPLADAIAEIDDLTSNQVLGYMVNCSYPSFINAEKQPQKMFERFIGIQANSSSLDHADLDGSEKLHSDDISDWIQEMVKLNKKFGVKILGGCCGTGPEYLEGMVRAVGVNKS